MIGDEFEAESGGVVVEPGEFLALHFFCFFLEYFGIKWLAIFEEVPKDARQFVRHGRDGFRGSQPGLPAAVAVAKVVVAIGIIAPCIDAPVVPARDTGIMELRHRLEARRLLLCKLKLQMTIACAVCIQVFR